MATKSGVSRRLLAETRQQWPLMSLYERFEQVVAIVLSLVIAVVVALALAQLLIRVVPLLVSGAIHPLDHEVFQALFGMVMTLLIALSRKFVILDTKATSASTIAAPAGATLVLGVVYWLLREPRRSPHR